MVCHANVATTLGSQLCLVGFYMQVPFSLHDVGECFNITLPLPDIDYISYNPE